jgi:chromosome partitioning protein
LAVVAVYSVKGGVGKTTIAVDLAWRFAVRSELKTLLWDLDQQGGAGFLLGEDMRAGGRAAAIFQREGKPGKSVTETAFERLSLIAADHSLRHLPLQLARLGQRKRLAQLVSSMKRDYPPIVLDCPAGLNEVTEQALFAADVIIVPLPPSPLSARALDTVRSELARNLTRHAPILPVLSMYDSRRKFHREIAATLAYGWPSIPMASVIEQCAVRRLPLGVFADRSEAGHALDRLWRGIEAKLAEVR